MGKVLCAICLEPIDEESFRVDEEVKNIVVERKKVPVHADCYFTKLGDEIEKHPIGGRGHVRGR